MFRVKKSKNESQAVRNRKILLNDAQWIYSGDFLNDKPHGKGKLVSRPFEKLSQLFDESYEGELRNGIRHGHGKYLWKDGSSYEGTWNDGEMHGTGKFVFPDKFSYYDGEWNQGRKEGEGMFHYQTGDVYKGQWKDEMRHGIGKLTWNPQSPTNIPTNTSYFPKNSPQQSYYEGQWNLDIPHGYGVEVTQASVLSAWFEQGKPNGFGREVFLDGTKYIGGYKHGKFHGYGKLTASTFAQEGMFKNGLMHGHGIKSFSDGTKYDGEWKAGIYHGTGLLFHPNGNAIFVDHKDGSFIGQQEYFNSHQRLAGDILMHKSIEKKACECLRRAIKYRMQMSKVMFIEEDYPFVFVEKKLNNKSAYFVGEENLRLLIGYRK